VTPNWVKVITLIIDLLIKYGPTLMKIAQEIYEWVETWSAAEELASKTKVTNLKKAAKFNILMIPQWEMAKGTTPRIAELDDLRDKTVLKNNLKARKFKYSYTGGKPG